MLPQNRIILFILIVSGVFRPHFLGDAKVVVKNFENCNPSENYKAKVNVTYKTVDDKQYVDGTFVLSAPLDNHMKSTVSMEMLVGKSYQYLFSINETKSCDAMNKYFGEFWYDIQRCAQMVQGICPLTVGRYHLHNCLLNFDKLTTLRNFPFGNLRFTDVTYESNSNSNIFTCIRCEVENRL